MIVEGFNMKIYSESINLLSNEGQWLDDEVSLCLQCIILYGPLVSNLANSPRPVLIITPNSHMICKIIYN